MCPCTTGTETRCSSTFSSGWVETKTYVPSCFREPPGSATTSSLDDSRPLVVSDRAIDGLSLVALCDLVVSAGGTMNREAAALGVPVYTTFAGRLGAVDEGLVHQGRLRLLTAADDLDLVKRAKYAEREDARSGSSSRCSVNGTRGVALVQYGV